MTNLQPLYGIRHVASKHGMIKKLVAPPRLSEWTEDIEAAQKFEFKREAQAAADYVTAQAFNVEVFEII